MGCSCRKGVSPDDTSTTRVVVIGTGGAGKSTVIKQVRIANGDKFSVEERKQAVRTICGIILLGLEASSSYVMDSGINGLSSTKTEEKDIQEEKEEPHDNHIFDIPPEQAAETANLITRFIQLNERQSAHPNSVRKLGTTLRPSYTLASHAGKMDGSETEAIEDQPSTWFTEEELAMRREMMTILLELYDNRIIQTVMQKMMNEDPGVRSELDQLSPKPIPAILTEPSTQHFLKSRNILTGILENQYVPSNADMIIMRKQTSGVQEYLYNSPDGQGSLCLVDVGGQVHERQTWSFVLEGATAIIFVTALDDYWKTTADRHERSRLEESLQVFRSILSSEDLVRLPIIVLFNKKDLLERALVDHKLDEYFPSYVGYDSTSAINFIREMFKHNAAEITQRAYITDHVTCATDSELMNEVWKKMAQIIFTHSLMASMGDLNQEDIYQSMAREKGGNWDLKNRITSNGVGAMCTSKSHESSNKSAKSITVQVSTDPKSIS